MFESETFIQSSSLTLIFVTNPNQKILSCFYKKLFVDLHLLFGMCCAHVLIEWFGNTPGANKGDWLQRNALGTRISNIQLLDSCSISTKRVDQIDVYSQQK